jgi:hypothetical protein
VVGRHPDGRLPPRLVNVWHENHVATGGAVAFAAVFREPGAAGDNIFQWVVTERALRDDPHWRYVTFEEYSDLWQRCCIEHAREQVANAFRRQAPVQTNAQAQELPATLENVQRQFEIAVETFLRQPPPMAPMAARTHYEATLRLFRRLLFGDPPPEPKSAEERARELLMSWLDPEQREEMKARAYFMVTGSAGGRYRIHPQNAYGVHKLNADDTLEAQYCFLPRGAHQTIGDIMLAQKISLETDETATLQIANRANGFEWAVMTLPPGTVVDERANEDIVRIF